MALSFIVTGTAWKWILNPGLGLEHLVRQLGLRELHLRLDRHTRDVDLHRGHRRRLAVDRLRHGAVPGRAARASTIPSSRPRRWTARAPCASTPASSSQSLRPVFFSAIIILAHIAIKSFDLVMALTGGGPGFSSDLPATFMYTFAFNRNQIGLGGGQRHDDADDRGRRHRAADVLRAAQAPPWLSANAAESAGSHADRPRDRLRAAGRCSRCTT